MGAAVRCAAFACGDSPLGGVMLRRPLQHPASASRPRDVGAAPSPPPYRRSGSLPFRARNAPSHPACTHTGADGLAPGNASPTPSQKPLALRSPCPHCWQHSTVRQGGDGLGGRGGTYGGRLGMGCGEKACGDTERSRGACAGAARVTTGVPASSGRGGSAPRRSTAHRTPAAPLRARLGAGRSGAASGRARHTTHTTEGGRSSTRHSTCGRTRAARRLLGG